MKSAKYVGVQQIGVFLTSASVRLKFPAMQVLNVADQPFQKVLKWSIE